MRKVTFSFASMMFLAACGSRPAPPSSNHSSSTAPIIKSADAGNTEVRPCEGDEFGLPKAAEAGVVARFEAKRGTMGTATKHMVASSHVLATEAGLAVLRSGGTAADAFVAAVLVQDVVLPGVTSTAGLAGILVYEAKTKKLSYVHGGVADPIEAGRRWQPKDTAVGKMVLVPGAPAAYAELARRFGKKPLSALVEPAAKLATNGFAADGLYARSITANRAKLERSAYGRKTFFHDGKPIAEGEPLKLEELGATLRNFGKDASWFYTGPWAKQAVALTNENGGTLVPADFEAYRVEEAPPLHGRYQGHDVYAAGHGGMKALVSLGALEALRGGEPAGPFATSPNALETLLRVQRATLSVPLLHDRTLVTRAPALGPEVAAATATVVEHVRSKQPVPSLTAKEGTHSSAVIVVDGYGNVVVGTHTIETMNWGEGLFVGGVPLSTSAPIAFDDPARAKLPMRIDPLFATIAFKDGSPVAALTVYGTGLHPADVQILDAVLGRGLDPESAVLEPRVGYFAYDVATHSIDYAKNSVDPRFSTDVLCEMQTRGFRLERSMPGLPAGFVDTGFPTLVTIGKEGLRGMTPDMSYIHGVAAGD